MAGKTMTPEVIYEDEDVVVINKPNGLVVHGDGRTPKDSKAAYGAGTEPTLVDWLLEKYPKLDGVGESWETQNGKSIPRPGIVHRLDRETSGVIVVAKTGKSFENLKKQFQERTVSKIYHAFVYGVLKESTGVIDRHIGKSRKDFRLWSAQRGARGELREAVTAYKVFHQGSDAAYVEVRPKTGRTHQIRVHFKAIHHPVVCDRLYAAKHECILGFTRLALHAFSITFLLLDKTVITVEAPVPDDFINAQSLNI